LLQNNREFITKILIYSLARDSLAGFVALTVTVRFKRLNLLLPRLFYRHFKLRNPVLKKQGRPVWDSPVSSGIFRK
jgi:hypothetical protein